MISLSMTDYMSEQDLLLLDAETLEDLASQAHAASDVECEHVFHQRINDAIYLATLAEARRRKAVKVQDVCTCTGNDTPLLGDIHCPQHGTEPQQNAYWDFEIVNGRLVPFIWRP